MSTTTLTLGAVAYDPKVITIWDGFRRWFGERGLDFDYVLYTSYERQVAGHFRGEFTVAWNSPLAWLQTERIAARLGRAARALAMRDTDQDLTSVVVVRADSAVRSLDDLRGRVVAVGAADSPQATLLPLDHLAAAGLAADRDVTVRRFDLLLGKHGDHVGGERDAARALAAGEVDAACLLDGNHLAFSRDGTLSPGGTRVLAQTALYDHCCFTAVGPSDGPLLDRFVALLLAQRHADPAVRPLMDLEGLREWRPGRTSGFAPLARAIGRFGTVDAFVDAVVAEHGGAVTDAARVALGDLGLDEGAVVLLKRALRGRAPGDTLAVEGSHPLLGVHLRAWCRARGDGVAFPVGGDVAAVITLGASHDDRWRDATRAGLADPAAAGALAAHPPPWWGLAARGAAVEAGAPAFGFALADRDAVWCDDAPRLYAQAAAAQWDPAAAIPWGAEFALDDAVEDAVVQVMTYLVENETAALVVPARFAATVHPHFREVMQVLAVQAADEARHIEVFSRRMLLRRDAPGLSTAGGQASLKTLVDATDFAEASFLLSVLGEGSFLSLLWFLHDAGPDAVTREVARRAAQDEARHVAFGLGHLAAQARRDPSLLGRLGVAIERRHAALQHTAGLNEEVHDALVLLAAGSLDPVALRAGAARVQRLVADMDDGRRGRLRRLGFSDDEARGLSALHTRNFM